VIDPSYNLALGSVALGAAFGLPGSPLKSKLSAFLGGIPLTLFGLFIAFQTTNLRFTFDDSNFSLVSSNLESIGENVVVGGENSWAYKSFVNYDFFPSRSFPILVRVVLKQRMCGTSW
jgi:NIMA (never in mitosis gene a)-related kinase